ncbi:MAG TPA: hypothetical protein PKD37_05550 [Oligoflexia bacterium]|nr:hypothetical protein [Oligoflexia bacterium]HMP27430.1 hypothetical protein [Oligoflexia bacterium]
MSNNRWFFTLLVATFLALTLLFFLGKGEKPGFLAELSSYLPQTVRQFFPVVDDLESDLLKQSIITPSVTPKSPLMPDSYFLSELNRGHSSSSTEEVESRQTSEARPLPTPTIVKLGGVVSSSPTPRVGVLGFEFTQPSDNQAFSFVEEGEALGENSLIPFARGRSVSGSPGQNPDQTPTVTPEPGDKLGRVFGQVRGYTILSLMHPLARPSVEKQIEGMLRAEVRDLFLGVLVDGTFRVDFGYLHSVLERLTVGGRSVTLLMYLTNGPEMRRSNEVAPQAPFSGIDPLSFRELLRFDLATRARFSAIARSVVPTLDFNASLSPANRNLVAPMLEDNFDRTTYQVARQIVSRAIGSKAQIIRNPCPRCNVEGNDGDPGRDLLELHKLDEFDSLRRGDGYSLDGEGFAYADDPPDSDQPRLPDLVDMLELSLERGHLYFALWRRQRQGIPPPGGQVLNPDLRNYEVPTDDQLDEEVVFLRLGLRSEE